MARCLRPGPTGRVLDVATGTGDLALAMAKRPHRPLVVGLDLVQEMLGPGAEKERPKAPVPSRFWPVTAQRFPLTARPLTPSP